MLWKNAVVIQTNVYYVTITIVFSTYSSVWNTKSPESAQSRERNTEVAHGEGLKFALLHQTWLVLAPVATLSVQQPSELHMAETAVKHLPWTRESALIDPGTTC